MYKKIIILFILLIPFSILSQDNINKITLDNFITESVKNSHFEEILIDELIEKYDESLQVPPGDFILSVIGEYQLTNQNRIFHGFKGGISLSKYFALSGTKLSGSYSLEPQTINPNRSTSQISLEIEQSIIKNAFGRAERIKKKLAGNEKEIAYFQIIEAYEDYLAALINLYLDWYSAYENLKFSEKSLEESKTLFNTTKRKLNYSIALPIDVNKSELQYLTKEENLIKIKSEYEIFIIQIKNIMQIELDKKKIEPDFQINFNLYENSDNTIIDEVNKKSRLAKIQEIILQNSNLDKKLALNSILPSATLYGGYTFKGGGYNFEENQSHYLNMGIKIDIDIPQPGFLAEYNKRKTEIEKSSLVMKNEINDMKIDLIILNEKINMEKKLLETTDKKVQLSKLIETDELKKYKQGRSSINDLITVYNTLDSNRISKITHTILFSKYYIEWLRLTDQLVNNNKEINLNPQKK